MFIRDHLAIVSRWAREQLREGVATPAASARLQELIADAEAVRAELAPRDPAFTGNVVVLKEYRRDRRKRSA